MDGGITGWRRCVVAALASMLALVPRAGASGVLNSDTDRQLAVACPNGGEVVDIGTVLPVTWRATGADWAADDRVKLEWSGNAGTNWNAIAGAESLAHDAGAFGWDTSGVTNGGAYRIRVSWLNDPALSDASDANFRMRRCCYVNDASTSADVWCTAAGTNAAGCGMSPNRPAASVQWILSQYDLDPGDVVRIDTGTYNLSANIKVSSADQGADGNPVLFEASPYGVTVNRGSTASGSYGWEISGAYVAVRTAASGKYPALAQRWMKVTGACYGVYGNAGGCAFERVDSCANRYAGLVLNYGAVVKNCLARGSTDSSSYGIYLGYSGSGSVVSNCTVAGNGKYGIYVCQNNVALKNNIVVADGSGDCAVYRYATGYTLTSDCNDLVAMNGALAGYSGADRATLAEWRTATGQDTNSLSRDPLFVNAADGDYHLQSTAGSYHGGAWTADGADSPGLDAGHGDAGAEPAPNASPWHGANTGMRNLGAYGGTEQGSKTPTNRIMYLYGPLGGESYVNQAVPVPVRWTCAGRGWQGEDTVRVEYSADSGATWAGVAGAEAVGAGAGQYDWDVSGLSASPLCRVRVTCSQDAAVTDRSSGDFRIGATMVYYVNDASTNLDAWTTATGTNAVGCGVSASRPAASVQWILAQYDLEPGDVVRIDTGTYNLSANIAVSSADQGAGGRPVVFEASPCGVTVNRGSTASGSYGWEINGSNVVVRTGASGKYPAPAQRWMKVTGAYYGVYGNASGCVFERVDACANRYAGLCLNQGAVVRNCLARGSTDGSSAGIYLSSSGSGSVVSNCTVAANGKYGIYVCQNSVVLKNNIVVADGVGDYAVYRDTTGYTLTSDDNDLFAFNGALVGHSGTDCATLADWRTATGQDGHGISSDPCFADASSGDVHLKSVEGRYVSPLVWARDAEHSPCIDAGDPASGWSNEPEPNGGRINMGAFGNTEQASKSLTNAAVSLTVVSAYGMVSPPAGVHTYYQGVQVNCSVTNDVLRGSTQYVARCWSGTGSVTSGSGTSVDFTIAADSLIQWNWSTNLYLDVRTVGSGTVSRVSGWVALASNVFLVAAPARSRHFEQWSGDTNGCAMLTNTAAFAMLRPRAINACFGDNTTSNGVPEWWLVAHGLTSNPEQEVRGDADGDGALTGEEWIAGTDPTNALSVLWVPYPELAAGDQCVIRWTSVTGRWYSVSKSTNLVEGFRLLREGIKATPPINACTDAVGSVRAAFYEIGVSTNVPVTSNTWVSGDVPKAIPDAGTAYSTVRVSTGTGYRITDVDVLVRVDHAWDGDLEIAIQHPDGTEVMLSNRRGGSGDDFGVGAYGAAGFVPTTFDAGAAQAIGSGTAPFADAYRPDGSLGSLSGKALDGTWRLRVSDGEPGDVGTLRYWSLRLMGAP